MKIRLFSLLSLLTTASLAQQQTSRQDSVRTNNLNEVVVTATRTEKLAITESLFRSPRYLPAKSRTAEWCG
jgi:hypothetical protein